MFRIDDYTPYQSSVSVQQAAESSSAWANYTATATLVGFNASSGTALRIGWSGLTMALVAVLAIILYA